MAEAAIRRAIVAGRLARPGPRPARGPRRRQARARAAGRRVHRLRLRDRVPGLVETIERVRPTVLVGTTGVAGTFDEAVIRAHGRRARRAADRPAALEPDLGAEADPGRHPALDRRPGARRDRLAVRRRSSVDGVRHEIGQANNVFIFPGVGLGAIVAEARAITDRMFLLAARTLADAVSDGAPRDRGALPAGRRPARRSRARSRSPSPARRSTPGWPAIPADTDAEALVDGAMWWPAYVPYVPARPAERRRVSEAMTDRSAAAVLRDAGRAGRGRDADLAEPRAGEVRVRILASGVCHSDLHVRDGEWPRPTPIAMGHEGAGVVEAVGPGVRSLSVGQPVALSWLVPCGTCRSCRAGRPWACPDSPVVPPPDAGRRARSSRPTDGEPVLSYCGIGTMAERDRRPRGGRHPAARRRGSGGGRAHRLLRLDRRRGGAQDGGRRRPARASRSSVSAGSGCRA